MRGLDIRNAESKDVRPLARLHVEAWNVAYAPILTQAHLDWVSVEREVRRKRKLLKDGTPILIAEHAGEIVGFLVYSECDESEAGTPEAFEIDSFWIDHKQTRRGIGSALLKAMMKLTSPKRIQAWVLTGVDAGPAFYEKRGFRADEETRQDFIFLDVAMPMVQYVKKIRRRAKPQS